MEFSNYRETMSADIDWMLKFVPLKVNKARLV